MWELIPRKIHIFYQSYHRTPATNVYRCTERFYFESRYRPFLFIYFCENFIYVLILLLLWWIETKIAKSTHFKCSIAYTKICLICETIRFENCSYPKKKKTEENFHKFCLFLFRVRKYFRYYLSSLIQGAQKIALPYAQQQKLTVKQLLTHFSSMDTTKAPKELFSADIQKDLLLLEEQEGSVNFKFGVVYMKGGQKCDDEMLSNGTWCNRYFSIYKNFVYSSVM